MVDATVVAQMAPIPAAIHQPSTARMIAAVQMTIAVRIRDTVMGLLGDGRAVKPPDIRTQNSGSSCLSWRSSSASRRLSSLLSMSSPPVVAGPATNRERESHLDPPHCYSQVAFGVPPEMPVP